MARRLRQVVDLYVNGKVHKLRDGSPVWVQALNPFEQDTARNEAEIARARITLALKEFGSDEQLKVKMFFFEDGLDDARSKIIDAKVAETLPKTMERLRNDTEWTERLLILERGLDDTAAAPSQEETQLVEKIAQEYTDEFTKRLSEERDFLEIQYADADEDTLWADYLAWYLERRGNELQLGEFRLHQILYGIRWCEGVEAEGLWTHEECAGHVDRLFTSKEDVRSAPEDLIADLMDAFDDVEMTVREAKNSARQGSSSDSSPLPSAAAESTASTQDTTPVAPPGSSSSPYPKPSPSLVSVS